MLDYYDAIEIGAELVEKNRGMDAMRVYRDHNISVSTTGHDYDFIGYVENVTDRDIEITIGDEDVPYTLKANDWLSFLADDNGRAQLGFASKGLYQIA
ncbi:MAG: hypothetical protein IJI66_14035 [Erysipelotrichaceae bacterium]|nr:hypothetical protein [Erysipelotrichaceae bacterium]